MDIRKNAPAVARARVQIAADPDTVWRLLSDLGGWPRWKSDVRSVSLRGPLAPGSMFVWKAGAGTLRPTLREVERPARIVWSGATLGIKAIDVFRLEPRDDGTLVAQEESWEGLVVSLFAGRLRRTLQSSIDKGLADLKSEAERRPAADTSQSTADTSPLAADTSPLAADQRQAPERASRSS
jgi:uncharacterized protein YndB with AHSA1/START domain